MIHGIGQGPPAARLLAVSTAICIVLAATPAAAATLTVNTSQDVISEDGDCSLREAIINANNGDQSGSVDCLAGTGPADGELDTISFDPSLDGVPIVLDLAGTGEDAGTTGDLDIHDTLVIAGNGAEATIIDANGIDRAIEAHDDEPALTVLDVLVNDLTIRNGDVEGSGGAIALLGTASTLVIERCIVGNNTSRGTSTSALGGGVFSEGDLAVIDSTVRDNLASAQGGLLAGGGAMAAASNLLVRNTSVTGNRAQSETGQAWGGGLLALPSGNPIAIRYSIFRNNHVEGGVALGGGAYFQDFEPMLFNSFLAASEMTDNSAVATGGTAAGGAIYMSDPGGFVIVSSTLAANSAGSDGTDTAVGGGIANFDVSLLMQNVTLTGNEIAADTDAQGGGFYSETDTSSMSNSILAENTAIGGSGSNCSGPLQSAGYNLIGSNAGCPDYIAGTNDIIGDVASGGSPVDPVLGALGDYGGDTRTRPPQKGSPVIDSGNPGSSTVFEKCADRDQRNVTRPVDGNGDGTAVCDRGAFEVAAGSLFRDRFESD